MNRIKVLFSLFVLLCFGCSELRFEESQPRELHQLDQFPDALMGRFVDVEGDTTEVTRHQIINRDYVVDLQAPEEEIQLKRYKDFYFLNAREEQGWEVMIIEIIGDQLIRVRTVGELNQEERELLKTISTPQPIDNDLLMVNPKIDELETLILHNFFDEEYALHRIE